MLSDMITIFLFSDPLDPGKRNRSNNSLEVVLGKKSAGILMYKQTGGIQVLLVHPGGPFWSRRDLGAWSLPKGEYHDEEGSESAARREFCEEVGSEVPGPLHLLGQLRQRSGKIVTAYAVEGDLNTSSLRSGTFDMEWPIHSGRVQSFPEVDRAEWFLLPSARHKILPGLRPFLDMLESWIAGLGACKLHGPEGKP
jgi:predicted NUDIX family NTP pyrophosphohydrolase